MKKIMTVAAMLMLVLVLGGCGLSIGPFGGSDDDDPNLGIYEAKRAEMMGIEMSVEDVFEDGFKMELKKKGKGKLYFDGDDAGFKWTPDGTTFHAEGGDDTSYIYSLANEYLVIVDGDTVMTFIKADE